LSEAHPKVRIVEYGAKFTKPNVLVGVPDIGLVGTIACSYLIEQLKLKEVGHIDADSMPQVMTVHNFEPSYPVHLFGGGDLVVVLSEVPFMTHLSFEVSRELAAWAKAHAAVNVIGISGLPSSEREQATEEQKPAVAGVTNDEKLRASLQESGIIPLGDGLITGTYASLLKECMNIGQRALILLAESHIQFPDPAASAAVIEALGGILSLKVDLKPLLEESEEIRLKSRELMQQTQQAQQAQQPPPKTAVYG
jgi:uncharacterized protein